MRNGETDERRMEGWKDGRMEGWVDTRNLNFNSARQRTGEDARLTIWRFLLERGVRVPGGVPESRAIPYNRPEFDFPLCSLCLCGEIPLRDL
jgi:hypothetical protein